MHQLGDCLLCPPPPKLLDGAAVAERARRFHPASDRRDKEGDNRHSCTSTKKGASFLLNFSLFDVRTGVCSAFSTAGKKIFSSRKSSDDNGSSSPP